MDKNRELLGLEEGDKVKINNIVMEEQMKEGSKNE